MCFDLNVFYIACLVMIGMYFFNRLSVDRNMDTSYDNVWPCGLFRDGSGEGLK